MIKSKVTKRSQTTLPNGVRKALGLRPGEDHIEWKIRGDQAIARRASADEDPALQGFLNLLEQDIATTPRRLRGAPQKLLERLARACNRVEVNLDHRIDGKVDL